MISVMAGVVAGAGLVGSICSGIRCSNGYCATKYDQQQPHEDEKAWSVVHKSGNENKGYSSTQQYSRNKKDETFDQLCIWKY